jgi:hypothetical protein
VPKFNIIFELEVETFEGVTKESLIKEHFAVGSIVGVLNNCVRKILRGTVECQEINNDKI